MDTEVTGGGGLEATISAVPLGVDRGETDAARELVRKRLFGGLARPLRMGRFEITGLLGRGGMGVVYAAHDTELDRQVAIKLLHPTIGGDASGRLQREARAMARLSHPNVVSVYDVGEFDGRVFVAMELVVGVSLREWMVERDYREILPMFIAAGRGLAAAHDAGVVHRDFKPHNVLVGEDGRARVLDFGLACGAHSELLTSTSGSSTDDLTQTLTMTGQLVGTPAYMAPEQFDQLEIDPRTDQFAFCVALYEAVYGRRPFPGVTIEEVRAAAAMGNMVVPDRSTGVPRRLWRILRRGLAPQPADRYADMPALLARLEGTLVPWRRTGFILSAYLAAAVGAAFWFASPEEPCTGSREALGTAWNADVRASVKRTLARSGSGAGLLDRLDQYADAWIEQHQDACEDTEVRKEQSSHVLGLRMACLDSARRELSAVSQALSQPSSELWVRGPMLTENLPPLGRCQDLEWLVSRTPEPARSEEAQAVASLRERLAVLKSLDYRGEWEQARPQAEQLLAQAEALGYEPLVAEAGEALGHIEYELGEHQQAAERLASAHYLARETDHAGVAASTAAELIYVTGFALADEQQAAWWARNAQAEVARLGAQAPEEARMLTYRGNLAAGRGDLEAAQADLERALELMEARLGADHPRVAMGLTNIGRAWAIGGDMPRAKQYFEQALVVWTRIGGSQHPEVASTLNNLGNVADLEGDHELAAELYARALSIVERTRSSNHFKRASILYNLATCQEHQGKLDEAARLHRRALDIGGFALGPEHPDLLRDLVRLARVEIDRGHLEEAASLLARGRRIVDGGAGLPEDVGWLSTLEAELALDADQPELAVHRFTDALASFEGAADAPKGPIRARRGLQVARERLNPRPGRARSRALP